MESELPSIVNVRTTYFTENILNWSGILNNDIAASIKAAGASFTPYITWNSDTSTYTVVSNFVWSAFVAATGVSTSSFILLQAGETFDGAGCTIDLTGISNWNGLIGEVE